MTIEEAIKHFRHTVYVLRNDESIIQFGDCIVAYSQLAEWLEELKDYREIGTVEGYKSAIECYTEEYNLRKSNVQYNKAIDDFIHECDKYCGFYSGKNKSLTRNDILKIAEQLKDQKNDRE